MTVIVVYLIGHFLSPYTAKQMFPLMDNNDDSDSRFLSLTWKSLSGCTEISPTVIKLQQLFKIPLCFHLNLFAVHSRLGAVLQEVLGEKH